MGCLLLRLALDIRAHRNVLAKNATPHCMAAEMAHLMTTRSIRTPPIQAGRDREAQSTRFWFTFKTPQTCDRPMDSLSGVYPRPIFGIFCSVWKMSQPTVQGH